ncbi:MAG: RNA polymerase sigma factor [Planctomycetota bacterium]|jgi:RNA polymerase sigma-70 factor (ECF subfamily)
MSTNDEHYIVRCLDGHPDDFRYLVRRYQGVLLAHLAGHLGNRDKAEEAAQETLVRAYFHLEKLKKRHSFFPWLLGIADRVAKEQQRAEQRRSHIAEVLAEKAAEPELSQDFGLERVVAALPPPYRELVLLRYYGGCSCSEIAEQLGMPLGTVTKNLSRAYAALRDSVQRQNESEVHK